MDRKQKLVIYALLSILVAMVVAFFVIKEIKRISADTIAVLYFLNYDEEERQSYLVQVKREIPRSDDIEDKIRFAIEELLKGLTEQEKEDGLLNTVTAEAKLIGIALEDNIVYLDFSKEIEEGGGTAFMTDRLAQIVFTATQFYPVSKVRLLIEGEFIEYFSGEGITDVEQPMNRDNFNYQLK